MSPQIHYLISYTGLDVQGVQCLVFLRQHWLYFGPPTIPIIEHKSPASWSPLSPEYAAQLLVTISSSINQGEFAQGSFETSTFSHTCISENSDPILVKTKAHGTPCINKHSSPCNIHPEWETIMHQTPLELLNFWLAGQLPNFVPVDNTCAMYITYSMRRASSFLFTG
uniref:Uncharacterized protein n=1 Tax=Arundo donax TaxID=35708 RepID=A0A0A8ZKQ2_ARUDO